MTVWATTPAALALGRHCVQLPDPGSDSPVSGPEGIRSIGSLENSMQTHAARCPFANTALTLEASKSSSSNQWQYLQHWTSRCTGTYLQWEPNKVKKKKGQKKGWYAQLPTNWLSFTNHNVSPEHPLVAAHQQKASKLYCLHRQTHQLRVGPGQRSSLLYIRNKQFREYGNVGRWGPGISDSVICRFNNTSVKLFQMVQSLLEIQSLSNRKCKVGSLLPHLVGMAAIMLRDECMCEQARTCRQAWKEGFCRETVPWNLDPSYQTQMKTARLRRANWQNVKASTPCALFRALRATPLRDFTVGMVST